MAKNNRLARTVILEEDGQTYTFEQLGNMFGAKPGTVRSRWERHGRHDTVSIKLCLGNLEKKPGTPRERVEYPGHGLVTFTEIMRLLPGVKRGFQFFRARWAAFGRPDRVTPEMFTLTNDEVKELVGASAWTMLRDKGRACDAKYTDPDFLPDIPFNDLSHLSGSTNTGAARNGEQFDNRKTFKSGTAFQGRTSFGVPCYQGGR